MDEHNKQVIYDIKNLCTWFPIKKGGSKKNQVVKAVDYVSLKVYKGETLGIVGESGCGKSTLGKSIMGLENSTGGEILYNQNGEMKDVMKLKKKELFDFRKEVQMVFQDPYSALICDEPVSALDVSIQAQVLNLMKDIQKKLDLTYIFIAHDLSVVQYMSDRIVVMYLGKIVEIADCNALYANPSHPYTKALLSAIPIPDIHQTVKREILSGEVPSPIQKPKGCAFHTRCKHCIEICREVEPEQHEIEGGHFVVCHLYKNKEGN